jgi:signal peptidase I
MGIVKRIIDFVMEILETIAFVGSIFIAVYLFIMQPNQVKGASMVPTFISGDYIFTSKVTYKMRPIQRGDIVVFKEPRRGEIEYIKRVIGLPGDQIMIENGTVYLNNSPIQESYINLSTPVPPNSFLQEGITITVPAEHIFVMGDNREVSSDSREFGPVRISSIIGQVFYRYFPFNKIGGMKNPLPQNLRTQNFLHYLLTLKS